MHVVRRSTDRYRTETDGVVSYHSFSFGAHYDAANVGFGSLIAFNDENLQPGKGFEAHRHARLGIVTIVLSGTLVHVGDTVEELRRLDVQVLQAGAGTTHAETAAPDASGLTRFLQLWFAAADAPGTEAPPSYERRTVPAAGSAVVAEIGAASVSLQRLAVGERFHPFDSHVFVVDGAAESPDLTLAPGDDLRVVGETIELTATAPTELLVTAMP